MFWKRPLIAATAGACCWSIALMSSSPPICPWNTLAPSIVTIERVAILHAAHVPGRREAVDVQLVVAVGREQVLDEQAAARAERQALDARGLVGPARRAIRHAARPGRGIAERPRGHDAGRGDVLLEERRRHRQHAGHVVEAVGLVVLGQQRAGVDANAEQILDRVGVLGAVQAMERDAARIRIARRRCIERHARATRRTRRPLPRPAAARRAAASCRRAACARAFSHRLGVLRDVARDRRCRRRCPLSSRAGCGTDAVGVDQRARRGAEGAARPESTARSALSSRASARPTTRHGDQRTATVATHEHATLDHTIPPSSRTCSHRPR